jgi:type II secretory pathway component PulF
MRRAAEHAETTAATQAAVRAALAYPAMVALAGCGAVAVMVGVVMPRFAKVLADLDQPLPPSTRLVLNSAELLRGWGGVALVGLTIAAILLIHATRQRPDGRRTIDRLLLQLPGIGTIRWAGATARFAASVAAMLECGVTLRTSLRHATAAVGDAEITARLELARARVDAGDTLGRSLDELGVVTPLAARLVAAGEESGRLPGMLAFAARLEQARADRLTKTGVRLVEPALILAFAAIVGLVAAAMLQAVYSVRPV